MAERGEAVRGCPALRCFNFEISTKLSGEVFVDFAVRGTVEVFVDFGPFYQSSQSLHPYPDQRFNAIHPR